MIALTTRRPRLRPAISRIARRQPMVVAIYVVMGCLSVPIGGIVELVVVHGGFTPMIAFPPPPTLSHMISALVLFLLLRCTVRTNMAGAFGMAAGFGFMAMSEGMLEHSFPHLWMLIYAAVDVLC
ncbi:hypothetical protein [Gymnodinialimonas mytili]|uniref:hypothetical protein n=1 Tax=Gymnodinialimonas mytili TaxID=3126503 RepID=UPI0030EBE888